jgi:gluconate 2-dehydrogenase gamma chain
MTQVKRRDILKLGAAVTSLAALPVAASAQAHAAQASNWTPSFFNPHQSDTITDFVDLIIPATDTPGAKDAQVTRYLDKLLTASDRPFQNEFANDLDVLDRYSRQISGAEFVRLTPDQQKAILQKMFLSEQRPSFDRLKAWTARIYYATKPGFDELNKGVVERPLACPA